jgi:DNA (cytosine-5)-methyltransferase 1
MPDFYEFFAGAGMARAGLGKHWNCLFANDLDHKKSATYRLNWGAGEMKTADVGSLTIADIPGVADLIWASFPCQDLSLAGACAGLKGNRSGTFWPFWSLTRELIADGRGPKTVVLENVCGAITSHGGADFTTICSAVQEAGYSVGCLIVDAALFVPQSRPRLFIVCTRADLVATSRCWAPGPVSPWHSQALRKAQARLPETTKRAWIWWNPPTPARRKTTLSDLIEEAPEGVVWYTKAEVERLVAKMSELNRAKLEAAKAQKRRLVGCVYRRTREDELGRKVQRAEIRFDNVSGCLRTPAGGSSRQIIFVVEGESIRARLISSRETARLMGLPDTYSLPCNYNEAYHLTGDGVVVPVVRHLARHVIEPILEDHARGRQAAA